MILWYALVFSITKTTNENPANIIAFQVNRGTISTLF